MAISVAAKRYAQAVFDLAVEQKNEDRWRQELADLAEVLSRHEFRSLLESPRIEFSNKQRMLRESLGGLSKQALNLAYLLTSRGRTSLMEQIFAEYNGLLDEHRGVEHVTVTTSMALGKDDLQSLTERLGRLTGKQVVLEQKVDAAILGGLVVRWGDKLIDGSVRTKLDKLKRDLISTRVAA